MDASFQENVTFEYTRFDPFAIASFCIFGSIMIMGIKMNKITHNELINTVLMWTILGNMAYLFPQMFVKMHWIGRITENHCDRVLFVSINLFAFCLLKLLNSIIDLMPLPPKYQHFKKFICQCVTLYWLIQWIILIFEMKGKVIPLFINAKNENYLHCLNAYSQKSFIITLTHWEGLVILHSFCIYLIQQTPQYKNKCNNKWMWLLLIMEAINSVTMALIYSHYRTELVPAISYTFKFIIYAYIYHEYRDGAYLENYNGIRYGEESITEMTESDSTSFTEESSLNPHLDSESQDMALFEEENDTQDSSHDLLVSHLNKSKQNSCATDIVSSIEAHSKAIYPTPSIYPTSSNYPTPSLFPAPSMKPVSSIYPTPSISATPPINISIAGEYRGYLSSKERENRNHVNTSMDVGDPNIPSMKAIASEEGQNTITNVKKCTTDEMTTRHDQPSKYSKGEPVIRDDLVRTNDQQRAPSLALKHWARFDDINEHP